VGPVVGGLLAQIFGLRLTFLVTAGFYAVAFLVVQFLYHDERSDAASAPKSDRESVGIRDVLRFPHFLLLMAAIFLLQYMVDPFG
jgi:predicted MFS family arabinose efflux permease